MRKLTLLLALLLTIGFARAESAYNKGVEAWRNKDYAQGRVQWTQSIGEGGPDMAYNNLGVLYYYGLGGERDRNRAVALWLKGAALSVSESQLHLGEAYSKGHGGLKRSKTHAYAWYECARVTADRLSGSDPVEKKIGQSAVEAITKLAPSLSKADRAAGELLAQEYIGKYASPLQALRRK